MLRVIEKPVRREEGNEARTLDELAREGARQMLVRALEAEVSAYLEEHAGERNNDGYALVVRNGRARERKVTLGAGSATRDWGHILP
jgi:putative transposase